MSLESSDFPPAAGHRFFIPRDGWGDGDELALTGSESRHCAEILRHRTGDRITAFDGHGHEAACEIATVTKREVTLKIVAERTVPRPAFNLVLAQAVAKNKAMDWLIQKATEIGVTRIVPLTTERTVVRIRPNESARHREKWERIALETAKQCTRAWLPEIADAEPLVHFLQSPPDPGLRIVAALDPGAQPLRPYLRKVGNGSGKVGSAIVLVGPEGDFSPSELSAARDAGFQPVSLCPNILRSETAALYALGALSYEFSD